MSKNKIYDFERILANHIEKENENIKRFTEVLDGIKEEIHKVNTQIAKFNSSHELKLLETKDEIYDTVFNKVVEKSEYKRDQIVVDNDIVEMKEGLNGKVDKNTVRLMWIVFTSILATAALIFKLD